MEATVIMSCWKALLFYRLTKLSRRCSLLFLFSTVCLMRASPLMPDKQNCFCHKLVAPFDRCARATACFAFMDKASLTAITFIKPLHWFIDSAVYCYWQKCITQAQMRILCDLNVHLSGEAIVISYTTLSRGVSFYLSWYKIVDVGVFWWAWLFWGGAAFHLWT